MRDSFPQAVPIMYLAAPPLRSLAPYFSSSFFAAALFLLLSLLVVLELELPSCAAACTSALGSADVVVVASSSFPREAAMMNAVLMEMREILAASGDDYREVDGCAPKVMTPS